MYMSICCLSVCLSICLPSFSVYVPIQELGRILQIIGRNVENVLRGITITVAIPADPSDGLVMRPAIKFGEKGQYTCLCVYVCVCLNPLTYTYYIYTV